MTTENPKDVVRRGYDRISHAYRGDTLGREHNYYSWIRELRPLLKRGDPVLDLGCGCGVPVARELADEFAVTGVDFSEVQIARARRLVPSATFVLADMCACGFGPSSFAAIVSFYAIIHLPLAEHRPLLGRCFTWLRPGGHLFFITGQHPWKGWSQDYFGATMFWEHAGEDVYLAWLREIGFETQWSRFVPEGDSGHSLILARRPPQVRATMVPPPA